jgi:hypothetical protein
MINITSWRRILFVCIGLVILAVLIIIIFVIPHINPVTQPKATRAFWTVVLIHLLPIAALIYTIIFSHRDGHFENGFLVTAGVILILLELPLADAASASLGHSDLPSTSIFLFICVGFDLIAGILSFVARYIRGHLLLEK